MVMFLVVDYLIGSHILPRNGHFVNFSLHSYKYYLALKWNVLNNVSFTILENIYLFITLETYLSDTQYVFFL